MRQRRSFGHEFRQNAVDLIVKQGDSFQTAADAVNVDVASLRNWLRQLAAPADPCGEGLPRSKNSPRITNDVACSSRGPRWNAKSQ